MSLSHSNFWEHLGSKMHGVLLKMKPHLGLRLSRKCTSDAFKGIDLIISLLHFHTPKYPYRLSPMPHQTLYFTTVTVSSFNTCTHKLQGTASKQMKKNEELCPCKCSLCHKSQSWGSPFWAGFVHSVTLTVCL